jgi:hypothetical protein
MLTGPKEEDEEEERSPLCDISTVHVHYIKCKVTFVHAMKAYTGSKSIASLTLNHCVVWR